MVNASSRLINKAKSAKCCSLAALIAIQPREIPVGQGSAKRYLQERLLRASPIVQYVALDATTPALRPERAPCAQIDATGTFSGSLCCSAHSAAVPFSCEEFLLTVSVKGKPISCS